MKAKLESYREVRAIREKAECNQAEMNAMVDACLEKMDAILEETTAVSKRHISKQETAVEAIGTLEDL
jgi:hypothetical protein